MLHFKKELGIYVLIKLKLVITNQLQTIFTANFLAKLIHCVGVQNFQKSASQTNLIY
jgi:hypothetical protein